MSVKAEARVLVAVTIVLTLATRAWSQGNLGSAARAGASGPVTYEWVGECKSIPQDWVCQDCANGNWSPSGQPGPADTARISGAAVFARGCEKSVDVLEVIDGGFLTIRTDLAVGQSATVEGVGFGDGSTFSSTIATAGPFVMTGSVNSWSRGILTGLGEFQVAPGAILFVSPATTEKSLDGTRLVNDGFVNSTSAFNLENAAEIENNGTWTIAGGNLGGTTAPNQNGRFENHGTLACVGPGNDIYSAIPIGSDGVIRSENREFYIASGGDHAGGRYEVADGGTIVLSGFDVGGIAHGVHVTGAVDAIGQGNLRFERETTFIEAGGTLDVTLETIEGNPGVVGLWIENCAIVQCDGELVNHGAMRWSRGTFTGATGVTNQTSGTLLIDDVGSGCGNARLETTLTNFGTAEQHNDVRLGDGGRIIAGGEYRMITGSVIDDGDDNLFRTILLLRRQGASPNASAHIGVPYEQTISGNILAEMGKLQFYGGGTVAGGTWSIQANAEISIEAGTMTFGPIGGDPGAPPGVANILGDGTFRIDGASTVVDVAAGSVVEIDIAPDAAEQEFDFVQGTLSGEIRNRGEMNWRGGTIAKGPGSFSNHGGIDIPSTGSRTLRGTLTNHGLITAGSFTVDGGELHNEEDMLLFAGTITGPNGGRIINRGAIVKEGVLTHTVAARLTALRGRVTVVDGTLAITGSIDELVDGVLTGGRWEVANGARLSIPGATITNLGIFAHVVLEGGADFPAIEDLVENGGSFDARGPGGPVRVPAFLRNDGTIRTIGGGRIETDGAVTNGALGDLSQTVVLSGPGEPGGFVIPTLINEGTLRPGGPGVAGVFALTGALEQAASGVIEIDLAGMAPIDGHDQVQVDGDVTLAGTLDVRVLPGYAPTGGETFTVLTVTNGTIAGAFDGVTGAGAYDVSYTATTAELTLVQPPVPGDVNADGVVNFGDVLAILSAWGACPNGSPCPADLDGNRVVNFADLLVVLSAWS